MEYAAGGTLFQYVATRRGLREDDARWFFQQIIIALAYCHGMVRAGCRRAGAASCRRRAARLLAVDRAAVGREHAGRDQPGHQAGEHAADGRHDAHRQGGHAAGLPDAHGAASPGSTRCAAARVRRWLTPAAPPACSTPSSATLGSARTTTRTARPLAAWARPRTWRQRSSTAGRGRRTTPRCGTRGLRRRRRARRAAPLLTFRPRLAAADVSPLPPAAARAAEGGRVVVRRAALHDGLQPLPLQARRGRAAAKRRGAACPVPADPTGRLCVPPTAAAEVRKRAGVPRWRSSGRRVPHGKSVPFARSASAIRACRPLQRRYQGPHQPHSCSQSAPAAVARGEERSRRAGWGRAERHPPAAIALPTCVRRASHPAAGHRGAPLVCARPASGGAAVQRVVDRRGAGQPALGGDAGGGGCSGSGRRGKPQPPPAQLVSWQGGRPALGGAACLGRQPGLDATAGWVLQVRKIVAEAFPTPTPKAIDSLPPRGRLGG